MTDICPSCTPVEVEQPRTPGARRPRLCAACRSASNRAASQRWRIANRDRVRQARKAHKQKTPEKVREEKRKYYALHRDEVLAKRAADRRVNPARQRRVDHAKWARRANAPGAVSVRDLAKVLGCRTCYYCGKLDAVMHVDHVVPLARGGTNSYGNLVLACAGCNHSKNDQLLAEWRYRRRGRHLAILLPGNEQIHYAFPEKV